MCVRAFIPKKEMLKTNTTGRAFLVTPVYPQYGLTASV